nr:hypothetical protein [Candidatus Sigynarchaeota archaeon]
MKKDRVDTAGLVVFYNPFEAGASNASKILDEAKDFLATAGFRTVVSPVMVNDIETARRAGKYFKENAIKVAIIRLATWSDDNLVLEMLSWIGDDVHVINWAFRDIDAGSLCGAQQFDMVLKELDMGNCHQRMGKRKISSSFVLGSDAGARGSMERAVNQASGQQPKDTSAGGIYDRLRRIYNNVRSPTDVLYDESLPGKVVAVIEDLQHLRVGIIGARTQGMMEVAFDEYGIKKYIGPSIIAISIDELKERVARVDSSLSQQELRRYKEKNPGFKMIASDAALDQAFRNYIALKSLIHAKDLGALAIDCYPRYMGEVCVAFSLLADEGVPCACEADVLG